MGLGNLFKAVIKTTVGLPIAVVKDVLTIGIKKVEDGEFFTEEKVDEIADELNKITKE